jgi:(1->4)-alpha-D-glucan 1-alpha-D-glucosylmutase
MSADLRATYRLQLHPGFTLEDAARIVGYLADLGVSHLYCSPFLQAVPGSTHGYDIVNPGQVNVELGGMRALEHLFDSAGRAGLGIIMDVVPNHMAIQTPDNPWWWDLLENGPASRYASYFDVEWDAPETRHANQVLAPVLGDHYGRVLEAGQIQVVFTDGQFCVNYFDYSYPVDPRSLSSLLVTAAERIASEELYFLGASLGRLPEATATDRRSARRRYHEQAAIGKLLQRLTQREPEVEAAIQAAIADLNADVDSLDAFLSLQNFRLAHWRITQRELGYRRFFDIDSLIGLRMEDEQVFLDTHALILQWLEDDRLDGLRIDHPDGMRDPAGYLRRLRQFTAAGWLVVEKILEEGEALPTDWPVDGTTGYDFLNRVNGLFVDPTGADPLTELYTEFTGESADYAALARANKLKVMDELLASDGNRLTALLLQICERQRRFRDFTRHDLREGVYALAASLPIYRTYVRAEDGEINPNDRATLEAALADAAACRPDLPPELFEFLGRLLTLQITGEVESEFVMRFQQFTGPVMAKGIEDTTFYNFYRLISLNEVGGDPGTFGVTPENFYRAEVETQAAWPRTMLASSTHDTKRSEDVRARLNVLSEIPQAWAEAVGRWAQLSAPYRCAAGPDRNDEYLIYQTLVGAWPLAEDRLVTYLTKAVREAKRHTSWTQPNAEYEEAVADFARGVLGDVDMQANVAAFVARIREPGWINSLSQMLIKLTAPGIPDIYQGTELFEYSLVDPDNRRAVDYGRRRELLAELATGLSPEAIWGRAAEGLPKLWLTQVTLGLRRAHPEAFDAAADFAPLPMSAAWALAYRRGARLAVVVPRLTVTGRDQWETTTVTLPAGRWRNLFGGEVANEGEVSLADLLRRFPVALLWREEGV